MVAKNKYIGNDKNINMGNAPVIVRFNLQNKQPSVVYKKAYLTRKDTEKLKIKTGGEGSVLQNTNQKKAGIAILVSFKIDSWAKRIPRDK